MSNRYVAALHALTETFPVDTLAMLLVAAIHEVRNEAGDPLTDSAVALLTAHLSFLTHADSVGMEHLINSCQAGATATGWAIANAH